MWDFDGGLVVKISGLNQSLVKIGGLPSNAEDLGLILVRKLRSHEPQINYPQLHPSIETRETAATKTTACCSKDSPCAAAKT